MKLAAETYVRYHTDSTHISGELVKGEKACGLVCNILQLRVNGSLVGCRSVYRRSNFVDLLDYLLFSQFYERRLRNRIPM